MGTVVLYPSPGMGHLISMVELGKLILNHHPSFSVIILTLTPSFNPTSTSTSYIHHISTTFPPITFHHLPIIPQNTNLYPTIGAAMFDLFRRTATNIHQTLHSISLSSHITTFIIDLFCTPAMAVAVNLNIPVYYFYTSGACCLAEYLHFPTLHRTTTGSFKDMNTLINSPGLPPIPSSELPAPLLDRTSAVYSDFLVFCQQLPKSNGIIVNTFDSLEPKAIKAISDGLCVPDQPTPPIFSIGPLISDGGDRSHECLNWLDLQPSRSVVYLCFGSSVSFFSSDQLKEIAIGLEMSGKRFLWVVKSPPSDNKDDRFHPPSDPDLDLLLPEGFLDRTKDRGLVVKTWAPQVAVLKNESVGGFVTHCGWNSVLEAVSAGVPMVAWPLYAEQRLNKVVLVEEMKLALPMESAGGKVAATEVAKRVRQVMEDEGIREVVMARKEEAVGAMSDGGSSRTALANLIASCDHRSAHSVCPLFEQLKK